MFTGMATLHKEVIIHARPADIWDAARDLGALHTRLVPGFVVDTRVEGDSRVVTFGNGMVLREPILSVDDGRRRMAWTSEGGPTTHYNAVLEIKEHEKGTRVVWTTDFLPHALSDQIGSMQEQGLQAMKKAFETRG